MSSRGHKGQNSSAICMSYEEVYSNDQIGNSEKNEVPHRRVMDEKDVVDLDDVEDMSTQSFVHTLLLNFR